MRRKWFISSCVGGGLLLAGVLWQVSFSGADPADRDAQANADDDGPATKPAENPLPIRRVVLFNTGVGYLQREGQIDGKARVELSFAASDMNDLLKSLILQDGGGGKVSAVQYDSHDPIEKTLRSFAIDLSANPTFGQILNQARGERIEVLPHEKPLKDGEKKQSRRPKLVGTIVGMETQAKPNELREVELLNLTTADGLQTIPLENVQSIRFLNTTLEKEFQRALLVLARAHDTQKRSINLAFQGDGKRTIRVGYVVERPIWKTSYRLRIEDGKKLFLQAWAMVENTSDDDWSDVHMVLVSGRPISFKMNLYEPLYIPRPEVEPELFASLRPPLYSGSLTPGGMPEQPKAPGGNMFGMFGNMMGANMFGMAAPPPVSEGGPADIGRPHFGGFQGFGGGNFQGFGNFQGGNFQGQFGYYFNNRYANPNAGQANFNAKLTYEQLQERRKQQKEQQDEALKKGSAITGLNFKEGIASVANAEEVGDYYQYVLDQKISLPRQKSAMLPIVNKSIEGTKVSIYNAAVQAKFPLLGLRLKNTSGQPLTQGPITVYEGHTYAGDTRVLDLQPGEERLLSYALDQATEVLATASDAPSPELYVKIGEDTLTANYKVRHTRSYTIRNRSIHDRKVIVEHPITLGWELLEPKKAYEKARDVSRFEVEAPANKTVTFKVTEEEATGGQFKLVQGGACWTCEPRSDIHFKVLRKMFEPRLIGMRLEKGVLVLRQQVRESTSYFVQNLSDSGRECTIDHIVRAGWQLLPDPDNAKTGPAVERFIVPVSAKKTAAKEFVEERTTIERTPPVSGLLVDRIRQLIAHPAASPELKAGLTKVLTLGQKLGDANARHGALDRQLRALSEDQARMRQNLGIIPQSSEHYKKFLEKFVAQETEIEQLQKQLRQALAVAQEAQREYEGFVANLTVE
jgi:hypothetical protein